MRRRLAAGMREEWEEIAFNFFIRGTGSIWMSSFALHFSDSSLFSGPLCAGGFALGRQVKGKLRGSPTILLVFYGGLLRKLHFWHFLFYFNPWGSNFKSSMEFDKIWKSVQNISKQKGKLCNVCCIHQFMRLWKCYLSTFVGCVLYFLFQITWMAIVPTDEKSRETNVLTCLKLSIRKYQIAHWTNQNWIFFIITTTKHFCVRKIIFAYQSSSWHNNIILF